MDEGLKKWLMENRYGEYGGVEITPQSKLVAYQYTISLLVITLQQQTRFYFEDAEAGKLRDAKVLCTLCNIFLGWWGIPWGPIRTIQSLAGNASGGIVRNWGEFAGRPDSQDKVDRQAEPMSQDVVDRQAEPMPQEPKLFAGTGIKTILLYIVIAIAVLALMFLMEGV